MNFVHVGGAGRGSGVKGGSRAISGCQCRNRHRLSAGDKPSFAKTSAVETDQTILQRAVAPQRPGC